MILQSAISVVESSQAGEARRNAAEMARSLAFPESAAGRLAIVVTEAANNLVRHASQGELLLRSIPEVGVPGIEVMCVDRGPGIASLDAALRDGHSTAGTPGTGLGAIQRLSDWFDIYSTVPGGTVLVSRIWAAPGSQPGRFDAGAASAPYPHERLCGDAFAIVQQNGRALVCIADGLGHGPDAYAAASEAVRVFCAQAAEHNPVRLLQDMHGELRKTRGAAVAIAEIDLHAMQVRYVGVGNIAGAVLSDGAVRRMVSYNGILGHEASRIRDFLYPWSPESLLVMHSDGLATSWDLGKYAGLMRQHPAIVAGVLYRDYKRGRDDVSVVVLRQRA